ncbi:MAG: hypothetical protein OET90_05160 [Desulfuromonadales bacterium]|nr:hypothetical protein [Desulfuromonadales bacterium]
MKEKMSISTVAETLNTTPLNVLMHVKRGMLDGAEEEGGWMINKASLDALLAKTGGGKAADVCASGCAKKHGCGGGCG